MEKKKRQRSVDIIDNNEIKKKKSLDNSSMSVIQMYFYILIEYYAHLLVHQEIL